MARNLIIGTTSFRSPVFITSPGNQDIDLQDIGAVFTEIITLNCLSSASESLNLYSSLDTPLFISVYGDTIEEIEQLTSTLVLRYSELISGFELNLSLPDAPICMPVDSFSTRIAVKVCVNSAKSIPVVVKLPPWPDHILPIARSAIEYGASALSATSSMKSLSFLKGEPCIEGLSEESLRHVALRCVYELAKKFEVPIIGSGGIFSLTDAECFIRAGASAVQVRVDGKVSLETARGMARLLTL